MSLQAALEAPRLHTEGHGVDVDSRVPAEVRDQLAHLGHTINVVHSTPYAPAFGRATAVWRGRGGLLHAAAEPSYGASAGA